METTTATIKPEQCPNPNYRKFHTRHRMPQGSVGMSFDYEDNLSRGQLAFLKSILAINGVESVDCGGYEIGVAKGEMFTWDELQPLIVKRIADYLARASS